MRGDFNDKTRLSWWYLRLPSDILTPKTIIVPGNPRAMRGTSERIIEIVHEELGWPFFLRTDYFSSKHGWKDTCFVSRPLDVFGHMCKIAEDGSIVDLVGLPSDMWILRKMIPTIPAFTAFRGDMPIVKERRYFVQDGKVLCHHPYWPRDAFTGKVSVGDWMQRLDKMNYETKDEIEFLSKLSSKVGVAVGGSWSIDWLWSKPEKRWYLTDMAEAEQSYHWEGCPNGSNDNA